MGSILQTIQDKSFLTRKPSLPVTHQPDPSSNNPATGGGIRRRLSSLSLNLNSISSSTTATATSWRFPRSKSLSTVGSQASTSIKRWWDKGWAWVLSKKLHGFGEDLEMNEGEKRELEGSWRHVLYKVKAEFRKLYRWRSDSGGRIPVNFRYDSSNYRMNFDDGVNGH